jgi:Rrf2 family protein
MPVKFLEQILLSLKNGGFVNSKRGINGGFSLAKAPKDITVGSVVRFIDGPIEPIACVEHERYKGCGDTASCIFRDVWREVKDAISVVIDTLTLEELVIRYKEKGMKIMSQYNYSI